MKIYLLYDNPFDEGDNVYGVFSSEEKAEKARELFTPKSNYDLFIRELDVDDLEKFFEQAQTNPNRLWIGWLRHAFAIPLGLKLVWDFSPAGLDSFLNQSNHKSMMLENGLNSLSTTIVASSKEEAEQIANEMLQELQKQTKDERGFRWVER